MLISGRQCLYLAVLVGVWCRPAVADETIPCDPATNAQQVRDGREALEKIRFFTDLVEKAKYVVPEKLKSAVESLSDTVDYLEKGVKAVEMGIDLGEAAGEVDAQLIAIQKNKDLLCEAQGDYEWPCKASFATQYQWEAVKGVLDWNNTQSVVRRVMRKWLGKRCDRTKDASTGNGGFLAALKSTTDAAKSDRDNTRSYGQDINSSTAASALEADRQYAAKAMQQSLDAMQQQMQAIYQADLAAAQQQRVSAEQCGQVAGQIREYDRSATQLNVAYADHQRLYAGVKDARAYNVDFYHKNCGQTNFGALPAPQNQTLTTNAKMPPLPPVHIIQPGG